MTIKEKFEKFLKDQNVYDAFMRNYEIQNEELNISWDSFINVFTKETTYYVLVQAFTWGFTIEGSVFWCEIHDKWCEIN